MTDLERRLRVAYLEKTLQDAETALYHSRTILRTILDEGAEPVQEEEKAETGPENYIAPPEESCAE